jgi:hypothetical protein
MRVTRVVLGGGSPLLRATFPGEVLPDAEQLLHDAVAS